MTKRTGRTRPSCYSSVGGHITELPDPTQKEVKLWLKQMSRAKTREGWIAVNNRFPGLTRGMRPFINDQFPDENERQAAFDGLTLALLAMSHFEDLQKLQELFLIQPEQDKSNKHKEDKINKIKDKTPKQQTD